MRRCIVEDAGMGIYQSDLETIFESFIQGDNSIKKVIGGTGLGFMISKSIAKQMGGNIDVESELGKGSTFTFSAIFHEINEGDRHVVVSEIYENQKSLGGFNVRVAEDDVVGRLLIQMLADNQGWHVAFAENGEEVLSKLPDDEFDVILMDIQMPLEWLFSDAQYS